MCYACDATAAVLFNEQAAVVVHAALPGKDHSACQRLTVPSIRAGLMAMGDGMKLSASPSETRFERKVRRLSEVVHAVLTEMYR
jgi:hypothetical protein